MSVNLLKTACLLAAASGILFVTMALSINAPPPGKEQAESRVMATCKTWLGRDELAHSLVGLEVMHLPSGNVLFSFNGNRRFVPASVAKVFTGACAISLLGADFTYKTKLLTVGEIKGETLFGDLVAVPSQDPSLELKDINRLLAALDDKKIKRIEGRIRIAPVAGGSDYFLPGFLVEDWGQDWMPVSSNLVIDSNVTPNTDAGRGIPVRIKGEKNNAMLQTLLDPAAELAPGWVTFDPSNRRVELTRSTASASVVVTNPSEFNLSLIENLVKAKGIRRQGRVLKPVDSKLIAEHSSKPLRDLVKHMMHESDNLYAQQILRTLGDKARSAGKSSLSLEEAGLQQIKDWLSSIGVSGKEVILRDGCGLSRKSCVSPHSLNMVHKAMSGPNGSGFLDLLRTAGSSGSRPGVFKFKTGTMDSVRCLAGVMETTSGDSLAVSIMVNGHTASIRDLRTAFNALTDSLYNVPAINPAPSRPEAKKVDTGAQTRPPAKAVKQPRMIQRKKAPLRRRRHR